MIFKKTIYGHLNRDRWGIPSNAPPGEGTDSVSTRHGHDSEWNHEPIQNQMLLACVMSQFESKSGEGFLVMSQIDLISREVARAMSRPESIPWGSA